MKINLLKQIERKRNSLGWNIWDIGNAKFSMKIIERLLDKRRYIMKKIAARYE
jgi:hypothetical protein